MNVLYCKRHKQLAQVAWACPESDGFCNAVSMRLIPDNAETVERIAAVLAKRHGLDWPITKPDPNLLATTFTNDAEAILAAFDGETP